MAHLFIDDGHPEAADCSTSYVWFDESRPEIVRQVVRLAREIDDPTELRAAVEALRPRVRDPDGRAAAPRRASWLGRLLRARPRDEPPRGTTAIDGAT